MTELEEFRAAAERMLEAVGRGDMEAAFGDLSPDFEWHPPVELPDAHVLQGPEAVKRWFASLLDVFPDWRPRATEVTELREGLFLLRLETGATGRSSELAGSAVWTDLWEMRDGRLTRVRQFQSRAQALEAARATSPGPRSSGTSPGSG